MQHKNKIIVIQAIIIVLMSLFGFSDLGNLFEDVIDDQIILNPDSLNLKPVIHSDSVYNDMLILKGQTTTLNTIFASVRKDNDRLRQQSIEDSKIISSLIESNKRYIENINKVKLIVSKKDRTISRLLSVSTQLEINSKTKATLVDTTYQNKSYTSYWQDGKGWASIATVFNPETGVVNHSLKVRNKLLITEVEKDGESYLHITNENPFTLIDKETNYFKIPKPDISTPKKQNRFSIGLNAGYSSVFYNDRIDFAPTIGIGIQYALIRF